MPEEPWLRGPVPGVPAPLQPAAHALIAAGEDIERAVEGLTPDRLWTRPGGAASVGWHLLHLAGSTDRLCTYARGEALTDAQRAALALERDLPQPPPALADLLAGWRDAAAAALRQLAATDPGTFADPREVGRARKPSTVLGLLMHAAEHAQRHAGQVVATAKAVAGAQGVIYEVTATVRADLVADYEAWLPAHVAELLATGCFVSAVIGRSTPGRYRIRYEAPDHAALDRYLTEHAPRLRASGLARFPDGLELTREVWVAIGQAP